MESAEKVEVIPGDFGWNDVGSWTAVYELAEKDGDGNTVSSPSSSIQRSSGNLVESQSGKVIALVGVDNLAVVETEDAILVCNLKKSQYVRDVVEHLKSDPDLKRFLSGSDLYLELIVCQTDMIRKLPARLPLV